jgi:hypothetical protein
MILRKPVFLIYNPQTLYSDKCIPCPALSDGSSTIQVGVVQLMAADAVLIQILNMGRARVAASPSPVVPW